MDLVFENPEFLWLLVALVPFAVWDGLRRWGASRARQLASVAVRLALLAGVALAVAQPQLRHEEQVADVVFLVDRSASVPDSLFDHAMTRVEALRAELGEGERAALVLFDGTPEVLVYPGREWTLPEQLRSAEPVAETDLGMALQVALGLIPQDHAGRIVLVSDARPTQGAAVAAMVTAREREVAVWSVALEPGFTDPAVYDVEWASEQFGPGETIAGTVVLRGGPEPLEGTLRLTLGEATIAEEAVSLPANDVLRVPFEHSPETPLEPGLAVLRAELVPADPSQDPRPINNEMASGVDITGPPRVLVIASDTADVTNLAQALEAEELEVTVFETQAFADSGAEVDDYDLVVLSDVPAEAPSDREALPVLPAEHLAALRRYVSDGGGLVVFGGDSSYELGGYGQSELAGALPIELQPRDPEMDPAVTMIMILDNSGSMGTWAEGGTKMDLANQGAAAAMHLLRDFDRIGVMAVDDRVDWVVRMQNASDKETLERAIRGIPVGGGGIYVYTSLREAYRAIRTEDTPLRHVILFTDAADSEEQVSGVIFGWGPGPNSYDLARSMRAEGITVSVIAIGSEWDQDTNFCRNLADAGGGRFYITDRASQLQTLFVEETQRLVDSVLNENPFRVRSEREHPIIEGLDFRRSPRLRGLMQLEARPTADVLLSHPDGYPVLTTWQYGLGQVAAFAIDAGPRWADRWLEWDGYPVMYSQLARWALRRAEGADTALAVEHGDGRSLLTIARRSSEGLSDAGGGMTAELVDITDSATEVGATGVPVALQILEPGLWQAALATAPGRRYRVVVRDGAGESFAEETFVAPGAAEFRFEEADRAWLEALASETGGAVDPAPGEVTGPLATVTTRTATWPWWLLAAILLMPLDAFLRRPARDA
jgi:uncharacterized membrane protein/Mg-chelatase subunit ChlD